MNKVRDISMEVYEKANYKSVKKALDNEDFWIILVDEKVWHIEHLSFVNIQDRLYNCLKKEMSRIYPRCVYLYDKMPSAK